MSPESRVSPESRTRIPKVTRRYKDEPLTIEEISQLLWAAGGKNVVDGVTSATRTYPSASHVYPLEVYLLVGKAHGLDSGVYHYNWRKHSITLITTGDLRLPICMTFLSQPSIKTAPASIIFAVRSDSKYGKEGCYLDLGHSSQNVFLQAAALDLGALVIGGLTPETADAIDKIMQLEDEIPIYIMPIGREY